MVKRRGYKIVGLAVLILLCWMGYSPIAVSSTEVWSDNFNDGNYDGWTICENTAIISPSTWSAADNYLQIDQEDWGIISHPSDTAYGTWSFDVKGDEALVDSASHASIEFISTNVTTLDDLNDWTCYWIYFTVSSVSEGKMYTLKLRKNVNTVLAFYDTPVPVGGWQHIDVTRTAAGMFSVYLNGSLVMQVGDNDITTSDMFTLSPNKWHMIDNIVVDDEITITPTTTTDVPVDWTLIIIGVTVVVIVLVLVIIVLKRR
ncbi:MAG: hypothetical protein ACFFF4_16535 [Candidatus Thorarchaeota archaeon]